MCSCNLTALSAALCEARLRSCWQRCLGAVSQTLYYYRLGVGIPWIPAKAVPAVFSSQSGEKRARRPAVCGRLDSTCSRAKCVSYSASFALCRQPLGTHACTRVVRCLGRGKGALFVPCSAICLGLSLLGSGRAYIACRWLNRLTCTFASHDIEVSRKCLAAAFFSFATEPLRQVGRARHCLSQRAGSWGRCVANPVHLKCALLERKERTGGD